MTRADLHMHSTASDGKRTPAELMQFCLSCHLTTVALSDHDTVSGVTEAARKAQVLGITLIPAIEISSGEKGDIHILGYGIDIQNDALLSLCHRMKNSRTERMRKMCEKLFQLDMPIDYEELAQTAGDSLGRPHLARMMVKKGYVSDVQEAFSLYLERGKPAYVPKLVNQPHEVFELIKQAKGVTVLAHPGDYPQQAKALIDTFGGRNGPLRGIEVYYPRQRMDHFQPWLQLAHEKNMLVTGGSDYHFDGDQHHAQPGDICEDWTSSKEDIKKLLQQISTLHC